jgi:hypothetical protein
LKKITCIVLFVTFAVILALLFSPYASSISSSNPCGSSCHTHLGSYSQFFGINEADNSNQIPSTLNLTETKNVTVTIQNIVNVDMYSILSSVSVTLRSAYGHFSINSPTYYVGDLPAGTVTATWQINGTSEGFDYLLIDATATNQHERIFFSDSYNPSPLITVGQPTVTPLPAPTPVPTPIPAPTLPSTPSPLTSPSITPTPTGTSNPTSSPANQKLSVILLSPTQDEKGLVQTNHTIEWQANGGTSPINVTLEYTKSNVTGPWTIIASGLQNNGSLMWTTPNIASTYYIRVSVNDSGIPTQTTSTDVAFEVVEANAEVPSIPIATILIIIIAVVVVVLVGCFFNAKKKQKKKYSRPEINVNSLQML